MIIPYIIGFIVGFFLAAVLIALGWSAQELERAEEHKREMTHIIKHGEKMMEHNRRERKYLDEVRDTRAELKTVVLELQKRMGLIKH